MKALGPTSPALKDEEREDKWQEAKSAPGSQGHTQPGFTAH